MFGDRVSWEAEEIARKYKKSVRDVLLAAGLGICASRTKNSANAFKTWYAFHNPNPGRKFMSVISCHRTDVLQSHSRNSVPF